MTINYFLTEFLYLDNAHAKHTSSKAFTIYFYMAYSELPTHRTWTFGSFQRQITFTIVTPQGVNTWFLMRSLYFYKMVKVSLYL